MLTDLENHAVLEDWLAVPSLKPLLKGTISKVRRADLRGGDPEQEMREEAEGSPYYGPTGRVCPLAPLSPAQR